MNGRKRRIVVDAQGLLLDAVVHPAYIQDRDGAKQVVGKLAGRFPKLSLIWGDGGCAGKFAVIPRRWVVERTFAWLGNFRRLSKDCEELGSDGDDSPNAPPSDRMTLLDTDPQTTRTAR